MPVAIGTVIVAAFVAVLALCLWVRPRVSKHRPYALALGSPGLVFLIAAVVLAGRGGAAATAPLWAAAAACFAAAWAFWPTRDPAWDRFESAFRRHAGGRQPG